MNADPWWSELIDGATPMNATDGQPLSYRLHRAAVVLRSEVTATVLQPMGLTFPQYVCMRLLSITPGSSNADLAREAHVSPQAMNTVLKGLQERGMVIRPAAPNMGRGLPADLTGDGIQLLARTDREVRTAERRLLGNLSDAQERELKNTLGNAQYLIASDSGPRGEGCKCCTTVRSAIGPTPRASSP